MSKVLICCVKYHFFSSFSYYSILNKQKATEKRKIVSQELEPFRGNKKKKEKTEIFGKVDEGKRGKNTEKKETKSRRALISFAYIHFSIRLQP